MAHFARLTSGNTVARVTVVNNAVLLDENNDESEALGITFLQGIHGANTIWVQTSYNGNFRGKFALVGDTYDAINDVFLSPDPPVE